MKHAAPELPGTGHTEPYRPALHPRALPDERRLYRQTVQSCWSTLTLFLVLVTIAIASF
jgi:DNA-binding helix-hairpin-helix protein with protein kinase domain